jgi:poly(3-hydroxyoctanoate) depolymerase
MPRISVAPHKSGAAEIRNAYPSRGTSVVSLRLITPRQKKFVSTKSQSSSTQYLPIAYLPGAGGNWASWEPIASLLAQRREPLLFDYPGLGDSARETGIRSLSDLALGILEVLPERCDLVALSMGSALAIRLALDHPERIRRLVLVSPCGGIQVERFGALDWRESFREQRPHAPTWFLDDTADFSDRLGEILAPTLIVVGDEDLIAPAAAGRFLLSRLPGAKLEIIPGADHDLEIEHGALLASLIEAHLRR